MNPAQGRGLLREQHRENREMVFFSCLVFEFICPISKYVFLFRKGLFQLEYLLDVLAFIIAVMDHF